MKEFESRATNESHTHMIAATVDVDTRGRLVRDGKIVVDNIARFQVVGFVKSCSEAGSWADSLAEMAEDYATNKVVAAYVVEMDLN